MQPEIVHSTLDNMPFLLALWSPIETNEELVHQWESLTVSQQMPLFKAEHRKREWLATRLLMDRLGIEQHDFLANGKPILPRGGISISHCKGSVAVVTSEVNIGLDIQEPTEQIFTIRSKFCSSTEWRWLEAHRETLRALTIVWSAKEAIFKYWGEEVDFAQHIEILPFECDAPIINARYQGGHGERNFRLWHSTRGTLEVVIAI
jgi:4'-phosphopantetheinyl transferase